MTSAASGSVKQANSRHTYSALASPHCLLVLQLLASSACPSSSASTADKWTGSWYAAPAIPDTLVTDATFRTVVHLTAGGSQLRLHLSNVYGTSSLEIGAVTVSVGGVTKSVTFAGRSQTTLDPRENAVSDSVDLQVNAGMDLTVAVYYPEGLPQPATGHWNLMGSAETSVLIAGNAVNEGRPTVAKDRKGEAIDVDVTYFLSGVDVLNTDSRGTIVAIGDSITDGGSRRWPTLLAQRLNREGKTYGVLNAGICGNRILSDARLGASRVGESLIKRFNRDVLNQPRVKYVILFEGINDLASVYAPIPRLEAFTTALRGLAERAHERGIKIYVATITPSGVEHTSESVRERRAINDWIRGSEDFDGYIDFDRAIADPRDRDQLNPEFDSGDHLHPNDAGERALSEAVDLSMFK